MKKIKILFILITIILLSGCSGVYTINYNDDLSIDEELNLKIDKTENSYENSLRIFEDNNIDKNKYKIINGDDEVTIDYKETYINIEDYLINSKLYHQFYENIDYIKDKDNIDINANNNFYFNSKSLVNISNSQNIEYLRFNLNTNFKVNENNADEVSENTYSWIYNTETQEKNIKLNLSLKKSTLPIKEIVTIISVVIVSLIILINIIKNFANSRKIYVKF